MKFNRTLLRSALAVMLAAGATAHAQQKRNVILYIGDGFGIAPKTAARMAMGQGQETRRLSTDPNFHVMQLDALKYNGTITTHSLNSWVTDSAPGAACYASGQKGKIDNEFISLDPQTMQPIATILENAKKQGYAVGLVTTTRITHATPAVFATHIWNRDMEDYIAAQYISKSEAEYEAIFNSSDSTYNAQRDWVLPDPRIGVDVDVLLGGGSRHFLPKKNAGPNNIVRDRDGNAIMKDGKEVTLGSGKRVDNADLIEIAKTRGYKYVNSRDALLGLDLTQFTADNDAKLIGLFRDSHCDYEQDRQMNYDWEPNLAEMTQMAIEVLQRKSPKGFFLMVEAGRIDHLEHANCGGIGFTEDSKNYVVTADQPAIPEDMVYGGPTDVVPNIYGSDYMIKEVLALDYAVGKGRQLMSSSSDKTLLLVSSDHECGGFAVVGLHDENDAQKNGTKVRTYAQQPKKPVFTPTPVNVTRGDAATNGWFPDYTMEDFQGYMWPKAVANSRRIVVSYGSNPVTNGNGSAVGGTPGNHTPQDILVYADDNVNGEYASRVTGHGLMDNTDLTPIMADFLGVNMSSGVTNPDGGSTPNALRGSDVVPNPVAAGSTADFEFTTDGNGRVVVEVYNSLGQRVRSLLGDTLGAGTHRIEWNTRDDRGGIVSADSYMVVIKSNGTMVSKKFVVVH